MTFWNNPEFAPPNRKRNFKVSDGSGDYWFWAKTVSKPSFEISTGEYQLVNHKVKYPGLITWNDITITVLDMGDVVKKLVQQLGKNGFAAMDGYSGEDGIYKLYDASADSNHIIIEQYGNDLSSPVQKWELANGFIKSIDFGDLS